MLFFMIISIDDYVLTKYNLYVYVCGGRGVGWGWGEPDI